MTEQAHDDAERVANALKAALAQSMTSSRAMANAAIDAAFRTSCGGQAYFFVFTVSSDTTNAALAELLAVVRRRLEPRNGCPRSLTFWEFDEYRDAVRTAIEHVSHGAAQDGNIAEKLFKQYRLLFLDAVVFHPLKCSCTVLVPAGSSLDLEAVTLEASYVHTSGKSIFTRSVKKARQSYVEDKLHRYLDDCPAGTKFFLVPYCHEDFSADDRDAVRFVSGSLDAIKIDIDKAFFGSVPVATWLSEEIDSRLTVIDSTHYKSRRCTAENEEQANRPSSILPNAQSIWLISDRGESSSSTEGCRYYLCYHQLFRRREPFASFDENKPGWIDQVTLPHSLTGALLSVALGQLKTPLRVLDPFSGSGTTLLECAKRHPDVSQSLGVERFEGASTVFGHNLEYFTSSSARNSFAIALEGLKSQQVTWAEIDKYNDESHFAATLNDQSLASSAFHYIARRVAKRAKRAVSREPNGQRHDAIAKERWSREIDTLLKQINLASNCYGVGSSAESYSAEVTATLDADAGARLDLRQGLSQEVLADFKEENREFDLIITDPPYSINHEIELDSVVAEVFGLCLDLLRDGGLLIVVLPFATFNGQPFAPIVAPHMVRQLLLLEGAKRHRTVYTYLEWLHGTSALLRDGIYWRSNKLLERRALIFGVNGPPIV